MAVFPHLKDSNFPHVNNVDVYKYANEFDYSRYDSSQMNILLCSVPWDMGEAHIGNRTISGIGNVVYFGSEAKRDEWFSDIPDSKCFRFTTKYRELHRDNLIDVPVPFDVASKYNYLAVEYFPFPGQGQTPIQYETENGLDKWFWFVREVEFIAPNTTRLHLLNDAFQTFIYRLNVTGMMLERGHAPLFKTTTDTYLSNPRVNCGELLSPDVEFGDNVAMQVKTTQSHVFNDDCYCCIATTANPKGTWGTKAANSWAVPSSALYAINGTPDVYIFAISPSNLNTFLTNMENNAPQFAQTVKGVFFAPTELLTLGTSFTFCSVTCYPVSTSNKTISFLTLSKAQFGYAAKYADLAKLYTYPYACIQISDEDGNAQIVKIEETNGQLDISATLGLAFPALNIQAHVLGIGGTSSTLTFENITSRSLAIGGRWYETLHKWDVPLFGIIQNPATRYDYDSHFDRIQANTALTNAYNSAIATNAMVKNNADDNATAGKDNEYRIAAANRSNADDMATAAKDNTHRSADLITDIADLQTDANDAIHGLQHGANPSAARENRDNQIIANNAYTAQANNFVDGTTNAQIDATKQSAAVSAAAGVVSSGATAIASAATGNIPGAIGAAVGGIVNAGAAAGQAAIASNLTATQAALTTQQNSSKNTTSNTLTEKLCLTATSNESTNNTTNNNLIDAIAAGQKATQKANANESKNAVSGGGSFTGTAPRTETAMKANADESKNVVSGGGDFTGTAPRTKTTNDANAARTKNTAESAISNGISQAALNAPSEFGSFANTQNATSKPQMLLANILTQSKYAIEKIGDEFLRYGYFYNKFWEFDGNWNIGKHYTYWKLSDFWVSGLNIPDMYVDKLRFFLFGGVTVWRKPEDIGNVTIYENWS